MREGYTFSDEPGYYEDGVGGVRLETVLLSVKRESKYADKKYGSFLGFEPICLVPFEPKLIDYSLMSDAQIDWLNNYNRLIREKVGSALKEQGKQRYVVHTLHAIFLCKNTEGMTYFLNMKIYFSALQWMMSRTEVVTRPNYRQVRSFNSAQRHCHSSLVLLSTLLLFIHFLNN